ncbi:UbiA family prenyltransferase [Methanohalophilus mahii]|uniref:UbiA prenyltransferase n=1 Tax=Methanohalophilus mahii (strain ATCC 35705 / DSM 5219 / SLP) TaxID=547558 RepID=D5EBB6_METMS|nr:UbiA family prenyltransferase [Methanohalophilus mahii]ADE36467.1 hypothetical protein Mmah_0947 [Methanohalophilus mahii DSM 5219]
MEQIVRRNWNFQDILFSKIEKNLWKEFIYGGHLFAAGAVGVVYMASVFCNIFISLDFLAAIYLMFYAIYFYDYTTGAEEDKETNSERSVYIDADHNQKKIKLIVCGAALGMSIIYIIWSDLTNMVIGFSILVLGLLYHSYFKNLTRFIPAFKNFFVSAVWALLVFLLLAYYSQPITSAAILLSVFIFLRMLKIQILFDLRDTEGDKKKGLLTIPVCMKGNSEKLLNMLNVLNLLTIIVIAYGILTDIIPAASMMILLVFFYGHSYIKDIKAEKNVTSHYLLAAGEPILWAGLMQSGNICIQLLDTSFNLI